MSSYISTELRKRVAERAHHLCEYCLISEVDTYFGCEVDHVISEKHDGFIIQARQLKSLFNANEEVTLECTNSLYSSPHRVSVATLKSDEDPSHPALLASSGGQYIECL